MPYNARWAERPEDERQRFPKLPMLMSHGSYSGVRTLDDQIRDMHMESDTWQVGGFSAWNINASDEDVHVLHDTEGLMGLVFDQRVLGIKPLERLSPARARTLLAQHILAVVDVIMLDDARSPEDKVKIWDRLCIGTDFDGLIDPVAPYATALDFDAFADDLRRVLGRVSGTRMIDEVGVDAIVDKICWENAYDFALRHFPVA